MTKWEGLLWGSRGMASAFRGAGPEGAAAPFTSGGKGGSTALCIIVVYDSMYVVAKQTPASLKAGLSNAE